MTPEPLTARAGAADRDLGVKSAWVGGAVWILAVAVWHPAPRDAPWGVCLFLLSPLVLIPLGLSLAAADPERLPANLWRWAVRTQPLTALLLLAAFLLPAGPLAAALTLPWLATTALIALSGLARAWNRRFWPLETLCVDAGLAYLVVGGVWAAIARSGARPLNFEPVIVLLTAIHFHHAGFVLPILTGLAARRLGGPLARATAVGVVVGMAAVALGVTLTYLHGPRLVETASVWLLALSGLLAAGLHARLAASAGLSAPVGALWALAALSLAFSMILAALYGTRHYAPLEWLDIPWMRALHGTANGLGFGLAGMLAWTLANRCRDVRTAG